MAGDWIPNCKNLSRKPEVLAIAAATGRSRREVHSILLDFWSWADSETTDGTLPSLTLASLADACGEDERFWLAVVQVGWLRVVPEGLALPNFDRWNTKPAKERLLTTQRKRKQRSAEEKMSRSERDKSVTTEQNRTEQKKENIAAAAAGVDKPQSSPASKTPRKRDLLFDALAEVTASDQDTSGSHIGRVCKALRSADPPYTPEEVRKFPEAAKTDYPWFTGRTTLGMLEKYIGIVRAPPLKSSSEPSVDPAEKQRKFREDMNKREAGALTDITGLLPGRRAKDASGG